jgi:hypothetical protein
MARPKVALDAEEIEKLAAIGCSAEEMAALLTPKGAKRPIDHQTVERRFYATIKKGRMTLHRALKRELVKQAMNGNTAALIFALKAHCGMREHDPMSVVNVVQNAGPVPTLSEKEFKARCLEAHQYLEQHWDQPEDQPLSDGTVPRLSGD